MEHTIEIELRDPKTGDTHEAIILASYLEQCQQEAAKEGLEVHVLEAA